MAEKTTRVTFEEFVDSAQQGINKLEAFAQQVGLDAATAENLQTRIALLSEVAMQYGTTYAVEQLSAIIAEAKQVIIAHIYSELKNITEKQIVHAETVHFLPQGTLVPAIEVLIKEINANRPINQAAFEKACAVFGTVRSLSLQERKRETTSEVEKLATVMDLTFAIGTQEITIFNQLLFRYQNNPTQDNLAALRAHYTQSMATAEKNQRQEMKPVQIAGAKIDQNLQTGEVEVLPVELRGGQILEVGQSPVTIPVSKALLGKRVILPVRKQGRDTVYGVFLVGEISLTRGKSQTIVVNRVSPEDLTLAQVNDPIKMRQLGAIVNIAAWLAQQTK